ncbi:hypothetical protein ABPG74_000687 [Tetrahymena malaccensis]
MTIIDKFSDQLYQDQINNSKLQNLAVLFQINQQVQKIPWQLNLINEFTGYQLLGKIKNSQKYVPPLHNVDRTYLNQENAAVIKMFKKNPILTSVWHQVSKAYLQQLDQIELSQLNLQTKVDFFQKSFKYDNLHEVQRYMQIDNTFVNLVYDGMIYMPGTNKTYSTYQPPKNCPYKGPYNLDPRCRYYYQPSVGNISTVVYPPTMNVGTNGPYYASMFCQRRVNLSSKQQNDVLSILCISLNLQVLPNYLQNFGKNSKYQMLVDPQSLIVVYNSQTQLQQQVTVMQVETDNLQDKSQANIFLQKLIENSNYIILNTSSYQSTFSLENSQQTFEYNRNGTDCLVILNIISMVDKLPKIERNRPINPAPKFQLKKVYLFLNVITKENLQIYATNLKNTIYFNNTIFAYISYGFICIILIIQIYYSIMLGKYILNPVVHLTHILSKIRIQNINLTTNSNQKEKQEQIRQKLQSCQINNSQIISCEFKTDQANDILIDEQIDADFKGVCHSRDTQDLLESFQDMFKVLRFTTQNFYKEDASLQLLNLIKQIQHFQRFGNHRALGVCYNNMGVIHYNCGRFQEALENFQQAVVYANYELNTYSHHQEGEGADYAQSIKRITSHLRSSILNDVTLEFTDENISNLNNSIYKEKTRQQSYFKQLQSYQAEIYWSLFNRKQNLIKAMYMFILKSNDQLWEIIEDHVIENIIISQIYLPPSNKREIINYYILSKVFQKQNLNKEANQILNRLSNIYAKIQEDKKEKQFLQSQNQIEVNSAQSISNQQKKELFQDSLINYTKNLQFSYSNQLNNYNVSQNNNDTNNSFILFSPIKKTKLKSKQTSIQNQVKNKVYDLFNSQKINFLNRIQINLQQSTVYPQQEKMSCQQEQKLNQTRLRSSFFAQKKSIGIDNHKKKYPKIIKEIDSNSMIFQENDLQSSKISETNSKINLNQFIFSQEVRNKAYDQIIQQILQQPQSKQKTNSQSQDEFHNILQNQRLSIFKNISSQQKISKISNKKQNKNIKFIQQKKQRAISNKDENKKFIFYPVRKHSHNEKVKYEFSSDIYFQYCSIEHASYQIKQQNYYNAALILTQSFEQCQYYLPHLRKLQMELLCKIFQQQNIKNIDFEVANKKYAQMTYSNINIYLISACKKQSNKLKLYALCNDLINEILFKESDSFGLIQYDFKEQIFTQLFASTQIKLIQQNPIFFEEILLSLLPQKQQEYTSKLKNDRIQLQQKNFDDHPQLFTNVPSPNQNSYFLDTNLQSVQNSNVNLKTGFLKSQIQHSNKKAQNQKTYQELFNLRERLSSYYPTQQQISDGNNQNLEQIQLSQDLSQTSFESYSLPNQIEFSQTKENITKIPNQKYVFMSNLNKKLKAKQNQANKQAQNLNNLNKQFKEYDTKQFYTFKDNKYKEESTNIQNTQNDLNNDSAYNLQFQKQDSQNTQDLMNLQNKGQQSINLDGLRNRKIFLQEDYIQNYNVENSNSQDIYTKPQTFISSIPPIEIKSTDQTQQISDFQNQNSVLPKQILPFNKTQHYQQPLFDSHFEIDLPRCKSNSIQTNQINYSQYCQTDQIKSTKLNQLDNQFVEKQQIKNQIKTGKMKQKCKPSEYIFHLGVHACLKKFILNSDEKLSIHLAQNNYKCQYNKKCDLTKIQQTYLVYVTDQYFQLSKSNLMQDLTNLLINIGCELLILVQNDALNFNENNNFENIQIDGQFVVSFFNTEEKMLQYIYNNREHLKNYLIPMVLEHF